MASCSLPLAGRVRIGKSGRVIGPRCFMIVCCSERGLDHCACLLHRRDSRSHAPLLVVPYHSAHPLAFIAPLCTVL